MTKQDKPFVNPEVVEKETVFGSVSNCKKVNVRKDASKDSDVLVVLDAGEKVEIEIEKSTDTFHGVKTRAGIYGFIMKDFLAVE